MLRLTLLLALAGCNDRSLVVINTTPDALITSPVDGEEIVQGTPLTLVGRATDAETPGEELLVQWSTDRGPLVGEATWSEGEATLAIDDLPVGPRTLTLTVADAEGESESDSIDILVFENASPQVAFTAPEDGAELLFGEPVTVAITASDDRDAARDLDLSWQGASGPSAPNADGTATTVLTDLAVGAHDITVTVTDTLGVSSQATLGLFITDGDVDEDGFSSVLVGGTDCDDGDPDVFPGAEETCNGVDDDCDDTVDEPNPTAPVWYLDGDDDGFGAGDPVPACSVPAGHVASNTDCDDGLGSVNPEADEVCNGIDDDCDNVVDSDAIDRITVYADLDEDDYGTGSALLVCEASDTQALVAGDCDDGNPAVNPSATEVCNGIDDDCVGGIDDNATNRQTFYRDADEDTYGDPDVTQLACSAPAGFIARADDCNDDVPTINPGASERCNGTDDNCNGQLNDNPIDPNTYYRDADEDGTGNAAVTQTGCEAPTGYVDNTDDCDDDDPLVNRRIDGDTDGTSACTDCDDDDPTRYPGAPELCDGLDNDCNGNVPIEETANPDGDAFVECAGDCDNSNFLIYPGAPERCNAIDDDCDGVPDNGASCDCPVFNGPDGTPYQFCEGSLNWGQAIDACGEDYELVSITTASENTFLRSVIADFPWQTPPTGQAADDAWWTGGFRDTGSGGQFCSPSTSTPPFEWLSGEPLNTYSNWRSGEPNNATGCEGCIEIWLDDATGQPRAEWNDEDCGRLRNYICEGLPVP